MNLSLLCDRHYSMQLYVIIANIFLLHLLCAGHFILSASYIVVLSVFT